MSKRPVALEDILRFQLAGDTQVSPDGKRIVFTVKRIESEKNRYRTALYLADVEAGTARPFTGDQYADGSPRWSPDGTRIAFVSDREKEKAQIYLIAADGGEALALTHLDEGGIGQIVWSPDGSRIAFLWTKTPPERTEKARKEREEKGLSSPVRVHDKRFYRLDGMGYFDGAYPQIAVADVKTGAVSVLTDEAHHLSSLAWSPDGRQIAFIANRRDDDDLTGQQEDIFRLTVPNAGADDLPEIVQITAPEGPKTGLAWSPDGRHLAFIGHTDPDDTWGGRNERVLVIPATGAAEARDLTGASDKQVGYATLADMHEIGGGDLLVWSPDSAVLYFPVSERGDTRLYQIGVNGSGLAPLTPPHHEMGSFSQSRDGKQFGILLGTATEAYEVYGGTLTEAALELRCVSAVNQALFAEMEMQMPEPFEARADDGYPVAGWMLRPTDFDAAKKYPCIVYVHGGPAMQYGGQAAPFHELQWLAAQGYVVVFSNPRGSKGYGEAHTSAIKGDWGNRDWADIQAVTDYGAALPYVDADRMAIMGGSYGGFMTAWAVGHTERFACAITDRLVGNIHSMSGTCDFPWQHGKAWKGDAWNDPSDMWRCSPLKYAGNITTPLLIIHSDNDLRCPIGQAEELFTALRLQRKTVEFVRYPGESSHGMSRNGPPDLRMDRLRRNLAWLDKYLKADEA